MNPPAALGLAHTVYHGPGERLPLIVLHGLYGNKRNWATLAKHWAAERTVICADLRNHGDSPWDPRMDYPAMAADLITLIEGLPRRRAVLLGHSLGGKAAMMAALTEPQRVAALIVVDIAPVAYERPGLEGVDALGSVDLGKVGKRSDADAMLAQQVPDAAMRAFMLSNLERGDGGHFRWRVNLAAIADNQAALLGFPESEEFYAGPVLSLAGELSDYVDTAGEAAFAARFPEVRISRIRRAGHWVHADRPDAVAEAVDDFLADH